MNTDYQKMKLSASHYYHTHKKLLSRHPLPSTAIIDTGIFPHTELSGHLRGFYDAVNHKSYPYDDNGHGTHIAGIITGIFPSCPLFGIKALDENGTGKIPDFIEGMDFLLQHHKQYEIRVLNISLGTAFDHSKEQKNLIDYVEHAWDLGITVCAAAGNNGPALGSVTVPGISKKIITIGTYDDYIPIPIDHAGNTISHYSGRGPTDECILKPDILCPGSGIVSLNNSVRGYSQKSGTSMSTPIISGILSLITACYPDVTPKELKKAVKAAHKPETLHFDCPLFFSQFFN